MFDDLLDIVIMICIGFEVNDIVLCMVEVMMGKCGIVVIDVIYYGNIMLVLYLFKLNVFEVGFGLGGYLCYVKVLDSYCILDFDGQCFVVKV